jgi:hypothetical protein
MNDVSCLTNQEIADILQAIRGTGKNRVDIMMDDFDLSLLSENELPKDWKENEPSLRKLLQIGATKGWC